MKSPPVPLLDPAVAASIKGIYMMGFSAAKVSESAGLPSASMNKRLLAVTLRSR